MSGWKARIGYLSPSVFETPSDWDRILPEGFTIVSSGLNVQSHTEAEFDKVYAINVKSIYLSALHALPAFRKQGGGCFVNIASTEALGATKYGSPYTAAKTGVIGLTRSLAVELGAEGITVNCICPGPINTGMTAAIQDEHKKIFAKRRTALLRYGDPEEVAHGTLNFCLPASRYMTGAVLPVDGGLTIRNA